MKDAVRNLLKNAQGGRFDYDHLIFIMAERFGFEKPVKRYVEDLVKFDYVSRESNWLIWKSEVAQ
jgi:hypothetical protein